METSNPHNPAPRLFKAAFNLLAGHLIGGLLLVFVVVFFQSSPPGKFTTFDLLTWSGVVVVAASGIVGFLCALLIVRKARADRRVAALCIGGIHFLLGYFAFYMASATVRHWTFLAGANIGIAAFYDDVGNSFLDGRGCRRDPVRAVYWLNAAADKGSSSAMIDLYEIYYGQSPFYRKTGIKRDLLLAKSYLERAERVGDQNTSGRRTELERDIANMEFE